MKKDFILLLLVMISGGVFFLSLFNFKSPISIPGGIEENHFVMAAGIDKASSESGHKFKLTTVGEKFSAEGGKAESSTKSAEIISIEGDTIFDAIRNFSIYKNKSMFWGHIQYILVSEEVAKEDFLQVLDFFIRDHELRFDTTVLIVKDTSAESFILTGEQLEMYIPDLLKGVSHNVGKLSISGEVRLADIMKTFNSKSMDGYIPVISLTSREDDTVNPDEYKTENDPIGGGNTIGTKIEDSKKTEGSSGLETQDQSQEDKEQSEVPVRSGKPSEENESQEKDINESQKEESGTKDSNKSGVDSSQKNADKPSQGGGDSSSSKGSGSGSSQSQGDGSSRSSSSSSESKRAMYLNLHGYAVFDGKKLQGYLLDYWGRGLNWINSEVKSGIILVKDKTNTDVSLEIINANASTKIKYDGDMPEATINIEFTTNLGEILSQHDLFNEEELNKLKDDQNEVVKIEAEKVVEYAQQYGIDIIKISDAIQHQHPLKWDKIKDNWKEIFKRMKINVNVESNINRTYHIRQTIRSEKNEENKDSDENKEDNK